MRLMRDIQAVPTALWLTVALALPVPAVAKGPKCFPREGHCVAVVVNGQEAVPLTKPIRKGLEARGGSVRRASRR